MNGINYGHHWTVATYNSGVATSEMTLIKSVGFDNIRIAYPPFDNASIDMCKDMVTRALSLGFKNVIWGVVSSGSTVNLARWTSFKTYVVNSLAPWAQSINNPAFTLSIGNEEELHVDDTEEVSEEQCRLDLLTLAASVKSIYTIGKVDYTTDGSRRDSWYSQGTGSLDKIGFNIYYEWSPVITFRSSIKEIKDSFGAKGYISEWGTSQGFDDAKLYGQASAEQRWASNLLQRKTIIEDIGMDNFYFTFADGSFGVTPNKWALRKTDGSYRASWYKLTSQRRMPTL